MMREWSFYLPASGALAPGCVGLPPAADPAAYAPAGHAPVEGRLDPLSQRVELVVDDFGNQVPTVVDWQPPTPADDEWQTWTWDAATRRWVATPTVAAQLRDASAAIDAAAGAARLRYITEVPGQQGTYIDKAAEAQAYKDAGYTGTVPPLVQAEVDSYTAAGTSITAQQAADSILQISDYWRATVNPGIECARLAGKRQAEVAAQLPDETLARQQIEQAREAALQALAAI